MASSTLKKKKTRRTGLCDLPDEILLNILSFLPLKSAVATSLLSSRWHYLWTFIPNLNISRYMFKDRNQFINFMDRAMVLRKGSSLESFSLHCRVWTHNSTVRVNSWITSAIQCNVKNLDLLLYPLRHNNVLPDCLFDCQSLVKFDLAISKNDYILSVPSSNSRSVFSNLKILRLYRVTLGDYESAQKMLSCPLLEELSITRCYWHKVKSISVSTPNLKVLDVDDFTCAIDRENMNHKLCFVADNLQSFRYSGSLYNDYQVYASSSSQLSTAKIYMEILFTSVTPVHGFRCLELIHGLSKAHSLTLTIDFITALQWNLIQIDTIPIFEYLTRFNLESDVLPLRIDSTVPFCIDSTVLRKIFDRCPHLERLDIARLRNVVMVPLLSPAPTCFQTHLKRIYIGITTYDAEKGDAISALLNSCAVLEIMVINRLLVDHERCGGSMNIEELQNELNRLPRVSKDCRVVLKYAEWNSLARTVN